MRSLLYGLQSEPLTNKKGVMSKVSLWYKNTYAYYIMDNLKLLSIKEITDLTKLSRSTILRKAKKNEFPKSINLGGNLRRWRYTDIKNWQQKLA